MVQYELRGLSPSGFRKLQVSLAFVGFVVVFSSLKSLVMADWKCLKEVPMKKALMLGVRSVLETLWTIGTNCATAALPG